MKYLSAGVYYVCGFLALVLRGLTALGLWVIEHFKTILFIFVILGMFWLLISLSAAQEAKWQSYKEAHHCKKVGHMRGDVHTGVATTVGANGQVSVSPVVTTTPDKTGWLCDDGVTYWR